MSTKTKEVNTSKKTTNKANSKATEEQKAKTLKKVEKVLKPKASERIERLENFKLLASRYDFLKGKKDELDRFLISNDGSGEKIILRNAQDFNFEISNSQVIKKVLDLVALELNAFVKLTEKEIENFNI